MGDARTGIGISWVSVASYDGWVYMIVLLILFYLNLFAAQGCKRSTLLPADLWEQAQEDQLDYVHNQVLVNERVREETQGVFDIFSHNFNVIRRKVLPAHERRHKLNNDSRTLASDSNGLVIRGRHACRAESVVWENGTPNRLQGRRQQGGVQHARCNGMREQSVNWFESCQRKGFLALYERLAVADGGKAM
jgi:hypothetical protein